ncbi:MAG: hypothetical protein KatS3mg015_3000 [Fimbriimonadales bacterium]|nr:MAG: hypothetical protein KatS3mg015_3000 [Fimbriimonadales bacterium]
MGLFAWLRTHVSKHSGRKWPGSGGDAESALAELERLRATLEPAFSRETASPQTSSAGKPPSAGHCAAVAAIVWQRLGGELVSARVQGESHWFNRVKIGERVIDVDLTGDQFGLPPVMAAEPGRLHPGTRPRTPSELQDETIQRAILLARKAGLDDTVEHLFSILRDRAEVVRGTARESKDRGR